MSVANLRAEVRREIRKNARVVIPLDNTEDFRDDKDVVATPCEGYVMTEDLDRFRDFFGAEGYVVVSTMTKEDLIDYAHEISRGVTVAKYTVVSKS